MIRPHTLDRAGGSGTMVVVKGLRCTNLGFSYCAGRPVLRDVSAAFPAGSFTAVVGPNGAGKSTLLKLLLGFREAQSGSIELDGNPLRAVPPRERVRRLVYIPGHAVSVFPFTVHQVVAMGASAVGAPASRATDAIERVGLSHAAQVPLGTLSAGERQRATLARALAQLGPDRTPGTGALLADEPFASMDPRHAVNTLGTLRELAAGGRCVVVVMHDLTAAARYADRALILSSQGSVVAGGETGEMLVPANLKVTFGVPFDRMTAPDGSAVLAVGASGASPQP